MNNTHTLEDSLEEGEARKIAMLGQSEDSPLAANEYEAALRATPAYIRITMKILAIGFLVFSTTGYGFLITAAALLFELPVSMVIGNQVFDIMFIFYLLLLLGAWMAYTVTITPYRAARRAYTTGVRGFYGITRDAIINSFSDVVFNTILIITSAVFFATLVKFLLCMSFNQFCPSLGFGW